MNRNHFTVNRTTETLEELYKHYAAMKLTEEKVVTVVQEMAMSCIVTGSCSSKALGFHYLELQQVVELGTWAYALEPLGYSDHWAAVRNMERERGYYGMKFQGCLSGSSGSAWFVCTYRKVVVEPLPQDKQLSLF